jgi:PAS domain S-box-containing protein
MPKSYRILVQAVISGVLLLLLAPLPAQALEKTTIQLKWLHHFQFAGYYAALEKGFYRDAGLDVTIVEGGPEVEVEKAVLEGRADFGVGTSALLLHRAKGEDLVVLGQIFQHSPAIFLTPRKTGIRSIADMAGKRFMYSNQHGDMLALLKKNGIELNQITQIPHQADPRDLISGKADVMIAYSFNEPFILEQAGEAYLTFSPMTYGIDFYGDNLFTSRALVEKRPELARAFREATFRGWRYALDHKGEIADLIHASYSREKNREWLLFEANQIETLIQPNLVDIGYQSLSRWQQIAEVFAGLGMLPAGFTPEGIIYQPEKQENHGPLLATMAISVVIILVLSGIMVSFRRLNRRLEARIVGHQQTLDELRTSENKYVSIFNLLPDMVGITRLADGVFIEVNAGFERCTGWRKEEAINRSSLEMGLWDPETRARAVAVVTEKGRLEEFDFTLTTKSGARRHAVMNLIPITLGETPCLCFLARDVTERTLLALRRDDDQRLLQTIVDSIPDMIFYKDLQSTYLGCNESFAAGYIGRPKEEIVGRRDADINSDQELVSRYVESDRRVMESGRTAQLEHQLTLAKGTKAYVEVLKTPFRDSSGRVAGVIGIARDMTAHMENLAETIRQKEAAQRYLDIAGVMLCALDSAGTIILINRKGCQILGYSSDQELLGRNWFDLCLPPAVRPKIKEVFRLQLAGNMEPVEFFENEVLTSTGAERLIAFHTTLIRDREGICGVMFSGEDITEQRQMQAELLKSQKLESLGVLAGGIAHDFNNILTAILGNISIAKLDMEKNHASHSHLSRAEKAVQRAADLARQLLVFAKGGQPVKRIVSIQQIVKDAVSLSLSGTKVKGELDIPAPLQAVEADEGQISQCLHNILINAVHAMPEGGTLTVRGENVTLKEGSITGLTAGAYVKLTMTDTGCGISPEDQKRIFDPYFTTRKGGTGLGLASTHTIIKSHKGHIHVKSAPGKGTTFTLLLPAKVAAAAPSPTEQDPAIASHQGESILVMDDDEMVRHLAILTLERLGFTVTACSNGADAVSLYSAARQGGSPFSLVIMDLTIPGGMGGVEACRQLRAMDPDARVIVSSGYSDDPVMANFADYGFCAAIEKPYRVQDIAEVLGRINTENP